MKKSLLTLCLIGMAQIAIADSPNPNDVHLLQPSYGGSGCPQGTASAVLSPDAKSLSILFDNFQTEAGYTTGRQSDRKNCNVGIPVHIPQGFSVSILGIDYRGFNPLPQGAASAFSVEYFFAGIRGPRYQKTFRGPLSDEFYLRNELQATAFIWSRCGEDVILRTNMGVNTTTNRSFDQANTSVDSVDVTAGLVYHFQWKRCFR